MAKKKKIGKVIHVYPKISVAIIKLSAKLKKGDKISIEGHGKQVLQVVKSMEIEHKAIKEAKAKQEIGLKTPEAVKENDVVYLANE